MIFASYTVRSSANNDGIFIKALHAGTLVTVPLVNTNRRRGVGNRSFCSIDVNRVHSFEPFGVEIVNDLMQMR